MTTYHPIPVYHTEVTITQRQEGWVPARFSAFLYKPLSQDLNAPLMLKIKLNFRLIPIGSQPVPLQADADGKAFWTAPWTAWDWGVFIGGAKVQANMWNNKFWLIPPTTFNGYNFGVHGSARKWRPNVRCELEVDFAPSGKASVEVKVANLNVNLLLGKQGGPGGFRSHAFLYDSLDVTPWAFPFGQGPGNPTVHYVIAHEIGHAIGLDHIGTLRKAPLCDLTIGLQGTGFDINVLRGGRDGLYCYGYDQGIKQFGNIMGAGNDFSIECARPWKLAMEQVTGLKMNSWRAVTSDPGGGSWT